ncbi:hypothetical protein NDU88_002170 [Pleurodeles waltl]|uniref:Uncharacterized protein n=1 Tax=Pleurodeles waltl TaxID=8319 RepID=A0AAV7W1P4_PLEWA|nr:hypothetical protein NDU88_002170 [Pleurodeles waltl]
MALDLRPIPLSLSMESELKPSMSALVSGRATLQGKQAQGSKVKDGLQVLTYPALDSLYRVAVTSDTTNCVETTKDYPGGTLENNIRFVGGVKQEGDGRHRTEKEEKMSGAGEEIRQDVWSETKRRNLEKAGDAGPTDSDDEHKEMERACEEKSLPRTELLEDAETARHFQGGKWLLQEPELELEQEPGIKHLTRANPGRQTETAVRWPKSRSLGDESEEVVEMEAGMSSLKLLPSTRVDTDDTVDTVSTGKSGQGGNDDSGFLILARGKPEGSTMSTGYVIIVSSRQKQKITSHMELSGNKEIIKINQGLYNQRLKAGLPLTDRHTCRENTITNYYYNYINSSADWSQAQYSMSCVASVQLQSGNGDANLTGAEPEQLGAQQLETSLPQSFQLMHKFLIKNCVLEVNTLSAREVAAQEPGST